LEKGLNYPEILPLATRELKLIRPLKKSLMATNDIQGRFEVVESFAIASRKEFYLIGQMKEGKIQEN
jgi:hypothetical protein